MTAGRIEMRKYRQIAKTAAADILVTDIPDRVVS